MKIYLYTLRYNPASGGGSHHALATYIRAVAKAGHTPVLTTFFSDDNSYKEKPCEMREERFHGGFIALQRRVAATMRENQDADVHVVAGPTLMWGGGMYRKHGAVPVVVNLNNYTPGMGLQRNTSLLHRYKWYVWEKLLGVRYARPIDLAILESPVVQKEYEHFGYRFKRSVILSSPADIASSSTLPSPYPNDPALFHVLFAARLVRDKGPDLFVKAAIGLPQDIHMHVIGSGGEESLLRKLIEENKLATQVHLHGWKPREELLAFFRHASLFIHPCRWPKPFGLVVVEALRAGLPIVATEDTGAAWAAGEAGVTFKKDDVDELRKHILFFYNNPAACSEYSKKALARAHFFDADVVASQYVEMLKTLASSTKKNTPFA